MNILLPVKGSKGQFFRKYHFSPVKNVKKCRGRDSDWKFKSHIIMPASGYEGVNDVTF